MIKLKRTNILFYILFFIFILTSFIVLKSISSYGKGRIFSRDYDTYETNYRADLKDVLKEEGLKSSGITMTKVLSEEEGLSYLVSIHLPSNVNIDEREIRLLSDRLNGVPMPIEGASVYISFS